jgi:hypothetical protein
MESNILLLYDRVRVLLPGVATPLHARGSLSDRLLIKRSGSPQPALYLYRTADGRVTAVAGLARITHVIISAQDHICMTWKTHGCEI